MGNKRTAGDIVRERREHYGLSLAALATAMHASDSHLSDIENNRRVPSEEMLTRLCIHLKLKRDYMEVAFGRVPDPIRDAVIRRDFKKASTLVNALGAQ